VLDSGGNSCTCGDFAKNVKKNPSHNCKHILSVMNAIPRDGIENAKFLERQVPQLDPRFITNIKGKDFVVYAGVLDLATQKGLMKLEVELLQFPYKENGNEAICRAVAVSKTGEVFSDIGDANPKNCTEKIVKHLIRMASTRAKGRALRDMCNIGMACLEEFSDLDDVIGNDASKKSANKKTAVKPDTKSTDGKSGKAQTDKKKQPAKKDKPKVETKTKGDPDPTGTPAETTKTETKDSKEKAEPDQPKMSEAQKRAIYNLSRRRGISVEELENMATETYGITLEDITSKDAAQFIRTLQTAA